MKKIKLIVVSAFSCVFALCAFTACGSSETFAGVISDKSYNSVDLAAQAFLKNEIEGDAVNATFVSYEKTGDLSNKEVSALPLASVSKGDVTSAEKGMVSYSAVTAKSLFDVTPLAKTTKSSTVYILQIGDEYRYFAPVPLSGEALTQSYLESVMDPSKYANVTQTSQMSIMVRGGSIGIAYDISMEVQISETVAYAETKMDYLYTLNGVSSGAESETMLTYVVVDDTSVSAYVSEDGETWESASESYTMDTLVESMNESTVYGDHSCFEKTDTGFQLSGDKCTAFVEGVLGDLLGSLISSMTFNNMQASYVVEDGCITGMTMEISVSYEEEICTASASAEYTDFGKTKVSIPDSLTAYING